MSNATATADAAAAAAAAYSAKLEAAAKAAFGANPGLHLGPRILGFAFDMILLGVVFHQSIMYLSQPSNDPLLIRLTVWWLVVTTLAVSIHNLYYIWEFYVVGFGEYVGFLDLKNPGLLAFFAVLVIIPAQGFYAHRAYRLNKNALWILIVIAPLLITELVAGIAMVVVTRINSFETARTAEQPWLITGYCAIIAADVLLTGCICYGLAKAKTGWTETDKIVSKLMRTSFEAQIPSTAVGLGFLLTYLVARQSQLNYFWIIFYGKTFVVSILAVLNYRMALRPTATTELSQGHVNEFRGTNGNRSALPLNKIHVATVVYEESYPMSQSKSGINRQLDSDEDIAAVPIQPREPQQPQDSRTALWVRDETA